MADNILVDEIPLPLFGHGEQILLVSLAQDDDFFDALVSDPVEKFLRSRVVIKGSQYGTQLENAVREEEEALEKVVDFFQSKH